MTAFGNVQLAVQAMKLGTLDFVEKPIHNNPELLELVRRTLAMDRVAPKIQQEAPETGERLRLLTDREREILFRVADGLSSREITSEFELSLATVNSHRVNYPEKDECRLGAESHQPDIAIPLRTTAAVTDDKKRH